MRADRAEWHYITCEDAEWQRKRARRDESCTTRSRTGSLRFIRSIFRAFTTIDDLVRAMGQTAFTARQIGDAADVLEAMARDKDCFVVMTLSGAMTVAKMGLVFCDLVEAGVVKAIVSTGALMAHGLVEARGCRISATTRRWTTASFSPPGTTASTIRSSRKRIWITWKK